MIGVLTSDEMAVILQHVSVSNQHVVRLKFIQWHVPDIFQCKRNKMNEVTTGSGWNPVKGMVRLRDSRLHSNPAPAQAF